MPASKLKAEVARILQDEGYIAGFKMVETPAERAGKAARHQMRLFLKYGPTGEKAISGIERVSRPGRRVYASRDEVPAVLGGLGVSILTTSRGVMTGRAAQKAGVGGEILCNVW
jgi:small subunit ribosomal protein S8